MVDTQKPYTDQYARVDKCKIKSTDSHTFACTSALTLSRNDVQESLEQSKVREEDGLKREKELEKLLADATQELTTCRQQLSQFQSEHQKEIDEIKSEVEQGLQHAVDQLRVSKVWSAGCFLRSSCVLCVMHLPFNFHGRHTETLYRPIRACRQVQNQIY